MSSSTFRELIAALAIVISVAACRTERCPAGTHQVDRFCETLESVDAGRAQSAASEPPTAGKRPTPTRARAPDVADVADAGMPNTGSKATGTPAQAGRGGMQPKRAGAGADAPATPADDDDPSSAIEFVPIRAGVFQMGTPASEADHIDTESPVHEVTLDAFELSKFEITNAQYAAFLDANQAVQRPKGWRDDLPPDQPATGMTWAEAHQFAQWADASLPTEAQWEYAARAGSSGSRYGQLSDIAWVPENADGHVHAVGELAPNVWGTHDMLGNVWEWCSDLFGPYPEGAVTNPVGASQGANRAIRGGSFGFESKFARAGGRFANDPGNRSDNLGIRLVRDSRDK